MSSVRTSKPEKDSTSLSKAIEQHMKLRADPASDPVQVNEDLFKLFELVYQIPKAEIMSKKVIEESIIRLACALDVSFRQWAFLLGKGKYQFYSTPEGIGIEYQNMRGLQGLKLIDIFETHLPSSIKDQLFCFPGHFAVGENSIAIEKNEPSPYLGNVGHCFIFSVECFMEILKLIDALKLYLKPPSMRCAENIPHKNIETINSASVSDLYNKLRTLPRRSCCCRLFSRSEGKKEQTKGPSAQITEGPSSRLPSHKK